MAEQDKDHLARLLGQMASGDHQDESAHEEHDGAVDLGQAGAPPAPPSAPAPGRPVTPGAPRTPAQPAKPLARPQPALAAPTPPPTPRRAAAPRAPLPAAQLATPRPPADSPPTPAAPAPEPVAAPPVVASAADDTAVAAPPGVAGAAGAEAAPEGDPQQHEQEVAAEVEALDHLAAGEVEGDDDAVIVPAPPVESLAHAHPVKQIRPPARPPGVSLFVKRTMIPPLLTLGVVCIGLVALGFITSGGDSPYQIFAQLWFAIPVVLIGLLMLAGGLFTMMQVSNDPQYKAERAAAAGGAPAGPATPAGRP